MAVTIELYGVPRLRAARRALEVEAATVGEAMAALERECPALAGAVVQDGRLLPAYRLSRNGREFVTQPGTRVSPGDTLILVAADAGG